MNIFLGRILNEDNDWITLEIAKRDDVVFHLQQNEDGETVGGDRFLTLGFLKKSEKKGTMSLWDPFEDEQ